MSDEYEALREDAKRWAYIRDSYNLIVPPMTLLNGEHIADGPVGGVYADRAVDAMIAREARLRREREAR